ncbi:MAG: hypothetical protein J6M34_07410 [Clostridia bacterium]|nr:hypothetical protein [Clostridia bacterium]
MAFCKICGTMIETESKFCPACGKSFITTSNKKEKNSGKRGLWIALVSGIAALLVLVLVFAFGDTKPDTITQEEAIKNHFQLFYSEKNTLSKAKKDICDRLDQYLPPIILNNMSASERTDFVDFFFEIVQREDENFFTLNKAFDEEIVIKESKTEEGVFVANVEISSGNVQLVRLIKSEENWYPLQLLHAYYLQIEKQAN